MSLAFSFGSVKLNFAWVKALFLFLPEALRSAFLDPDNS